MSTSLREAVFLDSSVILRYFTSDLAAKDIIEGGYKFAVNAIVVYSEVAFNLLKLLYMEKYGEYKILQYEGLTIQDRKGYTTGIRHTTILSRRTLRRRKTSSPTHNHGDSKRSGQDRRQIRTTIERLINSRNLQTLQHKHYSNKRIPWLKVIP